MTDLPPVLTDPARMEGVVQAIERLDTAVQRIATKITGVGDAAKQTGNEAEAAGKKGQKALSAAEMAAAKARAETIRLRKEAGLLGTAYGEMGRGLVSMEQSALKAGRTLKQQINLERLGLAGPHGIGQAMKSNVANVLTSMRQLGGGLVGPGGVLGFLLYGVAGRERFRAEAAQAAHQFRMIGAQSANAMALGMQSNADRIQAVLGKAAREQFMGSARAAAQAGFRGEQREAGYLDSGFFGEGTISRAAALDTVLGQQVGTTMTDIGQLVEQTGGQFGGLADQLTRTVTLSQSLGVAYDRLKQTFSTSLGTLGITQQSYRGLVSTFKEVTAGFLGMGGTRGLSAEQQRRIATQRGMRAVTGLAQGVANISDAELANMQYQRTGKSSSLGDLLKFRLGVTGANGQPGAQKNALRDFAKYIQDEGRRMLGMQPGQHMNRTQQYEAAAMMQKRLGISGEAAFGAMRMGKGDMTKLLEGLKSPQELMAEGLKGVADGVNNVEALLERIHGAVMHLAVAIIESIAALTYKIAAVFSTGDESKYYDKLFMQTGLSAGRHLGSSLEFAGQAAGGLGTVAGFKPYQAPMQDTVEGSSMLASGVLYDFNGDGKVDATDLKGILGLRRHMEGQIAQLSGPERTAAQTAMSGYFSPSYTPTGERVRPSADTQRHLKRLSRGYRVDDKPIIFNESDPTSGGVFQVKVSITPKNNPRAEKPTGS